MARNFARTPKEERRLNQDVFGALRELGVRDPKRQLVDFLLDETPQPKGDPAKSWWPLQYSDNGAWGLVAPNGSGAIRFTGISDKHGPGSSSANIEYLKNDESVSLPVKISGGDVFVVVVSGMGAGEWVRFTLVYESLES